MGTGDVPPYEAKHSLSLPGDHGAGKFCKLALQITKDNASITIS